MSVRTEHGDSRDVVKTLADGSVDSCVTDPPYGIAFMGRAWDAANTTAFDPAFWAEILRVLKPGGHLVAFGGTRTYHRLACAIEDAGFEIRDQLAWTYGSGFPKSHNVGKGIDKARDDSAAKCAVALWLRPHVERIGFDVVTRHFGFKDETMTRARWTSRSQPNTPTWEQWVALKSLCRFGDEMDAEVWRLNGRKGTPGEAWGGREVIGRSEATAATGGVYGAYGRGFDLTAPATEAARQWDGWGTALKPAFEPIVLARKPLSGTVAANVLQHGTGALNIAACRVATDEALGRLNHTTSKFIDNANGSREAHPRTVLIDNSGDKGRWPANLVHDGSEEVLAEFAKYGDAGGGSATRRHPRRDGSGWDRPCNDTHDALKPAFADTGSAARFFMSCQFGDDDKWTREPAIFADGCSSLSNEAVASALGDAVAASMPGSALLRPSFQAPNTSATASELRTVFDLVIETIQNFARRFSRGSLPERLSLTLNHASCVAARGPTDTITITISRWKSNGSAGDVTFAITLPNSAPGARGSAPRFHFSAKADADDRCDSKHPTVKPVALMRWLARLVTPPGGLVLDPFAGSGTTGVACIREGFDAILIEREAEYVRDIRHRIDKLSGLDAPLFARAAE